MPEIEFSMIKFRNLVLELRSQKKYIQELHWASINGILRKRWILVFQLSVWTILYPLDWYHYMLFCFLKLEILMTAEYSTILKLNYFNLLGYKARHLILSF